MAANRFSPDLGPKPWPWFTTPAARSRTARALPALLRQGGATPPRWLTNTRLATGSRDRPRCTPGRPPDDDPPRLPSRDHPLVPRPTHRNRGLDPGLLGTTRTRPRPMRWNLVLDGGQPIADRLLACYEALTEHPFYLIAIQTTPAISTPTTASVLGDALGIAGRQVFPQVRAARAVRRPFWLDGNACRGQMGG
jgi:hypothetical protein